MAWYIPSHIQKQILRYALSKFDIFDTNALDLDHLDIAWGKRSSFELRDVALRIERLAELFQLPDYATIRSAKIALLRLSIPADIHTSGIQFEAEGLHLDLFLDPEQAEQKEDGKHAEGSQDTVKKPGTHAARSPQHRQHDPGGDASLAPSDDSLDLAVPTTEALAKSFVASESPQERAQFKEALAKSQSLSQSGLSESTASNTGDGYGEALTLPWFVADFLEGVKDRAHASVTDICIDIGTLIDFSSMRGLHGDRSYREDISLRLTIGELQFYASHATPGQSPSAEEGANSNPQTRRITIQDIRAALLSDPSLFNFLAQYSGPSSPVATHQSSFKSNPRSSPQTPSDKADSPSRASRHASEDDLPGPEAQEDSKDNQPSRELRQEFGSVGSGNHSASDSSASGRGSQRPRPERLRSSSISVSGEADSQDNSSPTSSDAASQLFYSNVEDADLLEGGTNPSPETSSNRNVDRLSRLPSLPGSESHAEASLGGDTELDQEASTAFGPDSDVFNSIPGPELTGLSSSDHQLMESRLFSHEEAASMYESAMSVPHSREEVIPGSWLDDSPRSTRQAETPMPQDAQERAADPDNIVHSATIENAVALAQGSRLSKDLADDSDRPSPEFLANHSDVRPESEAEIAFDEAVEEEKLSQNIPQNRVTSSSPPLSGATSKEFFHISGINMSIAQTAALLVQEPANAPLDGLTGRSTLLTSLAGSISDSTFTPETSSPHRTSPGQSRPSMDSDTDRELLTYHEVKIGRTVFSSDITLIRLSILALQQLQFSGQKAKASKTPANQLPGSSLSISIESFEWRFVSSLETLSLHGGLGIGVSSAPDTQSPILLELRLQTIYYKRKDIRNQVSQELRIGKFTFGYVNEPIVCFDSGARMRQSVRDTFAPARDDVKIDIGLRKDGSPEALLTTAPLCIKLDLMRFDELFAWFGGLSGMLELGSSMASTMTVPDPKPKKSRSSNRTRAVHFKTPDRSKPLVPTRSNEPPPAKMTARIGGLNVVVIGSASAVSIDGTAIKIARRNEAIQIRIDKIKVSGPYNSAIPDDAAPTLWLELLRLDYLPSPTDDDLDRLLALLSPSKDRDDPTDDILLDTFLRQRRQGAILRAGVKSCSATVEDLEQLGNLSVLVDDLNKLSTVARYLPDDERPGLLLLCRIDNLEGRLNLGNSLGFVNLVLRDTEIGQVTLPSLFLLGVGSCKLQHQGKELIGSLVDQSTAFQAVALDSPMIVGRMIGDELDPTLKVSLWNARVEYHVSTLIAVMNSQEKPQEDQLGNASTATLRRQVVDQLDSSRSHTRASSPSKALKFKVALRDSALALNPNGSPAKALLFFQNADLDGSFPGGDSSDSTSSLTIKRMSILLVDDVANLLTQPVAKDDGLDSPARSQDSFRTLLLMGYVSVSDISAAKIAIHSRSTQPDDQKSVEIDIRDELLVLETCADSTQTLMTVFNGLTPPTPPSEQLKYRTEVVPMQDMLASFYGTEYVAESEMPENEELQYEYDDDDAETMSLGDSFHDMEGSRDLGASDSQLVDSQILQPREQPTDLEGSEMQTSAAAESLVIDDEHFGTKPGTGEKQRWNSSKNAFEVVPEAEPSTSPFQLRIRDVHFIWNLFDGYDWDRTRETISQAVADLEAKTAEAQAKRDKRRSVDFEEEEDPVIGDFLFNSIYIGVDINKSPRDVARLVNRNIDDVISETASQTTGVTSPKSSSPSRHGVPRARRNRLRLKRSHHHKMTFELKGVSVDMTARPPGSEETQSSVDIRVRDLEIFDHVPTSTWKKFATYMHDAGEREIGTSMLHLSILNVRPIPELEASEIVLRVTVLPLRLHVDQDALDFLSRFFEFKDSAAEPATGSAAEAPFIQRAEISAIPLKLDFKPKRVDYAGIRSGRTTEFMNFVVLDAADMVLRHVIVYGVSGFDRLGKTLNDVWMPDVRKNQLPGVLAGLAPVRPLVNVGAGVRDLVLVPVREYRRDGRVLRSLQKGALQFARTTTTELAKLGVKLAVGTHTVLSNTEGVLNPQSPSSAQQQQFEELEQGESPPEEKFVFSPYADAPAGVAQGLRGAYRHLARDLLLARDAIIAMPGEVLESGSAQGAARAVLRSAPTVILRPALGVTKALGQTLMGATASLDRDERRRVEDKYKRR